MNIRLFNRFKKKFVNLNSDVGVLGRRTVCNRCDALLFHGEAGICCLDGKIKLRPLHPPTRELMDIFSGESADSKEFLKHVRAYNSKFAFTSLGFKGF